MTNTHSKPPLIRDPARTLWRRHVALLVVLMLVHIGCQLVYLHWFIEDAAISFAYAQNWAAGEGLVPSPGTERIEGFSNPTWVALMAIWELVGVDGFFSSKFMAGIFGALCIPLVWDITRQARGGPDAKPDAVSLIAALTLAASAQFAIWNASGLENSLFAFAMALGIWLSLREIRKEGAWPWSSVLWMVLAMTRPEGIMYAAWAGAWTLVMALHKNPRWAIGNTIKWLMTFFVPFGLYHWVRYEYFAWEFPNTYYSKLGHKQFRPYAWHSRGWTYMRGYSHVLWQGYFLPIYVVGLTGLSKKGAALAIFVLVGLAGVLLYPGIDIVRELSWWPSFRAPPWWLTFRINTLVAMALILVAGVLLTRRPGWRALVYCLVCCYITLFFVVYSEGDWMKGFRWFHFVAVPASVLFAVGVGEIADFTQRWWDLCVDMLLNMRDGVFKAIPGWGPPAVVVALMLGLLPLAPNIHHMQWFAKKPETGPFSVKRRVNYFKYAMKRMHVQKPSTLDVDMGANMFWGRWPIVDMAGLVDVSIAHHNFETPFVLEYLFQERRPTMAHVHGGWESSSRFKTHKEWDETFVEIPGYHSGRTKLHIGNYVRRDLLIEESWHGDNTRAVSFTDGVELLGWEMRSPVSSANRWVYLDVGVGSRARKQGENFRMMVVVSGDAGMAVFDLPPGYDWYSPHEWAEGETFRGRFSLQFPREFPLGTFDLGFVFVGSDGEFLTPIPREEGEAAIPEGALGEDSRFAVGEVRWPEVLRLVKDDPFLRHARAELKVFTDLANQGKCGAAEDQWLTVLASAPRQPVRQGRFKDQVKADMVKCYVEQASKLPLADQTYSLVAAHDWDHRDARYVKAADEASLRMMEKGMALRANEEWEPAFYWFRDAVTLDPTKSWARRYTEEMRDRRLGLDPESKARQEAERLERQAEAQLKRDERRKAREALRGNDVELAPMKVKPHIAPAPAIRLPGKRSRGKE